MFRRRHCAADGGALLARLHRHLDRDLAHEQVELGRSGRRVGAEQRGVEAVLLGDELHGLAHDGRMGAQLERRRGRASEADDVLSAQMIEQVADAADDQLHRAGRKHAGLDHHPERGFGEIGRRRGGLHDRRHARKQGRRELLEHSPHGEVEGIDVQRRALKRRVDMLSDEGALLRQGLDRSVHQHMRIRKLTAALRGEGEEGARAALDVDPAVLARCASQIVELVQLLLAGHDRLAERLEHPSTLMEGQLAECGAADFPRVLEHPAEIESAGPGRRHGRAVDGARKSRRDCLRLGSNGREA